MARILADLGKAVYQNLTGVDFSRGMLAAGPRLNAAGAPCALIPQRRAQPGFSRRVLRCDVTVLPVLRRA